MFINRCEGGEDDGQRIRNGTVVVGFLKKLLKRLRKLRKTIDSIRITC